MLLMSDDRAAEVRINVDDLSITWGTVRLDATSVTLSASGPNAVEAGQALKVVIERLADRAVLRLGSASEDDLP